MATELYEHASAAQRGGTSRGQAVPEDGLTMHGFGKRDRRPCRARSWFGIRRGGVAALALLGAALVGCGDDDTPAVCSSVDDLKTSVNDVTSIDISSCSAVDDLQSGLESVKSDLDDVKTEAKSQFSSQLDEVDSTFSALTTSVDIAVAHPTADTLAAVAPAVPPFSTAVQTLISDVQSTC